MTSRQPQKRARPAAKLPVICSDESDPAITARLPGNLSELSAHQTCRKVTEWLAQIVQAAGPSNLLVAAGRGDNSPAARRISIINMPVSLSCEASSETSSGIRRLRQLASFGRYGADVLPSADVHRTSSSSVAQKESKDPSLLASSLSSFYSWLSKQTGHKVSLGGAPATTKGRISARNQVEIWTERRLDHTSHFHIKSRKERVDDIP